MQLMAESGEEGGSTAGLGRIPGAVTKLVPTAEGRGVPHMGWNEVVPTHASPLFEGIPERADFYFVHNYWLASSPTTTSYCGGLTAVVQREHIYGVQFHPRRASATASSCCATSWPPDVLKVRVIPTLLYRDFGLVKGIGFDSSGVGSVMQAVKVYNMRDVDELVFLDVTATAQGRSPDVDLVDEIADECFMPLTVRGGVTSGDDVRRLPEVGADKVALGKAAVEQPDLVSAAASRFGAAVRGSCTSTSGGPRARRRSSCAAARPRPDWTRWSSLGGSRGSGPARSCCSPSTATGPCRATTSRR
jgi:hypothetical protein